MSAAGAERGWFIAATDTGAGKTYVAAAILRRLRAQGVDAAGFKPICCGGREDAEILCAASGPDGPELNDVNPVWLRPPAAPYVAAMIENRPLDLALVRERYAALRARHATLVVEGVGGWLVPLERDFTMGDLAAEFGLPVIVVVKNRLGALNHAALTVRAVQAAGLRCEGLILNCPPVSGEAELDPQDIAWATNRAILEDLLGVPVLADVAAGGEVSWPGRPLLGPVLRSVERP